MTGGMYTSIIGQGISGIGSGLQMIAAMNEQDKMDEAIQYELNRQQAYQNEGSNYFAESLYRSYPSTARNLMNLGAQNQMSQYNSIYASPVLGTNTTVTNPRQNAALGAYLGQTTNADARRAGYTNWLTDLGSSNTYYNSMLNALASRSQASANVLPLEVKAAQDSEKNLETWGQVVYNLGQSISGSGGGSGGGEFSNWFGSS